MKKIFFLLIAANGMLSVTAQTSTNGQPQDTKSKKAYNADSMLTRWVIDVNALGGAFTQDLSTRNTIANYTNALSNANLGNVKFSNGMSYGGDAQVGYFFGRKAHFGIGAGIMYLAQQGDVTLDNFHVEYQSTDGSGQTFRQLVTANQPIKEKLTITNVNIPIVLKYKDRLSKHWGIAADAGILYNLQMKNSYTTNASFDYEAIYQVVNNSSGNQIAVYDNSLTPDPHDLIITKTQYLSTHGGGNANDFLNSQRALNSDHNVGAGIKPNNNKGSLSYYEGSIGLLLQPSVNYYISDNVALNVGVYYMYQTFNHSSNSAMLTNKLGDYNSVLNTVSSTNNQSYGLNIGARFYFTKMRDRDHDGVPDRKDHCPDVYGLPQFNGCPDTDGDGIPDMEDSCVDVPGLLHFHGCPDSDGDGIPDKNDACPYDAGSARTHGCPDTDGDGIPDNEDRCPTVAGPISNMGCPIPVPAVDTPRPAPKKPRYKSEHDMTEPILFDLGKSTIKEESLPILTEAVMEMNSNDNAFVIIDGHTDNTGKAIKNDALSFKRANAVKRYLTEMGGDPKRMIGIGHGSREPIAPNTTSEGRAKNRRVIMSLKHHQQD